ncbi:hypothetical protein BGX34_008475 [Mortierella sp. NVP85]|nr:hypothetical protein BGX34_008475 [Mortierella sp. NVP85]
MGSGSLPAIAPAPLSSTGPRRGSGGSGSRTTQIGPVSSRGGRGGAAGGMMTSSQRSDNTGSRTQFHAPLEPEVVKRLDEIFFKFLQRICSDLNACDSKGDQIHQPLMAKKMQRLEASTDFRPFKFRIQAFTNAFHDDLIENGLSEDILPLRKVKVYLWKHRYISRFNEDGKKQKSKGNHVWNIEARKIHPTPGGGNNNNNTNGNSRNGSHEQNGNDVKGPSSPKQWEFREYSSRIAGQIIKFARVGVPYVYSPRIWDAQMACPTAEFTSPWLPPWLKWHNGELKGIPGPEDESCEITVKATYDREGEKCTLEMTFPLTVSDPAKEGELMDSQNEHEDEDELEEEEYDEKEQQQQHPPQPQDGNRLHPRQSQTQQQAQRQLQHLHLQEKQPKSDDDMTVSDDQQEIDEDDDMEEGGAGAVGASAGAGDDGKRHLRKQSRERRSLLLAQETKRRKHD